jgi:hypothetical protein
MQMRLHPIPLLQRNATQRNGLVLHLKTPHGMGSIDAHGAGNGRFRLDPPPKSRSPPPPASTPNMNLMHKSGSKLAAYTMLLSCIQKKKVIQREYFLYFLFIL